ncbi:MAG: sigma-70 family RNA polymerase sigma factor [Clostridia bacterium]|nr:sigma-70 family RNA polymerase sigma factor [Clostridia bacterium]
MKNYQDFETADLVTLTLAGEQNAYEALVLRYQRAVVASAAKITGNEYMAEDAAQDAFVTAWLKLNLLREQEKFGAWVCCIAKNCAKNMVLRYRDYISFDIIENAEYETGESAEALLVRSEETDDLHESISTLPEKIKTVIKLHYFEGYSIAEIAAMMRIPAGTVKYQLHEGRKKIRKELCAMNENMNDTLVQKVMKKVEELKLWRLRDNKEGFADVYNSTLREVEELPESRKKQGMLADVLLQGWWWLPGKQNDELFARIKAAAIESRNEDVMEFVVSREQDKVADDKEKREFMRNVQIPELEEMGFTKARASVWFWLGRKYFRAGMRGEGYEAMENVLSLLTPKDVYYANALAALNAEKAVENKDRALYHMNTLGTQYRFIGSRCYMWSQPGYGCGAETEGRRADYVTDICANCDGILFDNDMKAGDVYTSTNGVATLAFEADDETVETLCGTFTGCERWVTRKLCWNGSEGIYTAWYKAGVGCVQSQVTEGGVFYGTRKLKAYEIKGGEGKMPFTTGNRWEYETDLSRKIFDYKNVIEVTAFDGKEATLSHYYYTIRGGYDETNFEEMMKAVRGGYHKYSDGELGEILVDVTPYLEKAEKLAKTPLQKAHFSTANNVMRRILETDAVFNPERTAIGYWNFFQYLNVCKEDGKLKTYDDRIFSFEWKEDSNWNNDTAALLYNFIFDILQTETGFIWNDEWKAGFRATYKMRKWGGRTTETLLSCREGGTVTTAAGQFNDTLCVSIDVKNNVELKYHNGKKDYYFADGVGLVRFVVHRPHIKTETVYDLAAYSGTGEGYMPTDAGLWRRYEGKNLAGGYVSSVEYTFEENEKGELIMLIDQEGIGVLEK